MELDRSKIVRARQRARGLRKMREQLIGVLLVKPHEPAMQCRELLDRELLQVLV